MNKCTSERICQTIRLLIIPAPHGVGPDPECRFSVGCRGQFCICSYDSRSRVTRTGTAAPSLFSTSVENRAVGGLPARWVKAHHINQCYSAGSGFDGAVFGRTVSPTYDVFPASKVFLTAVGGIRTLDQLITNQLLYQAELPRRRQFLARGDEVRDGSKRTAFGHSWPHLVTGTSIVTIEPVGSRSENATEPPAISVPHLISQRPRPLAW